MYLAYIDESGDPGQWNPGLPKHQNPSEHYCLSAFIIPADDWRNYLSAMVDIRRQLKAGYGMPVRAELHAAELIHPRSNSTVRNLGGRDKRVQLYSDFMQLVASRMPKARIISVNLNKVRPRYVSSSSRDIEEWAWKALLQRYQTYLVRSCNGSSGMVFADETNEEKIRSLMRRMRQFNRVPSMYGGSSIPALTTNIVEDPIMRNSKESYFVQVADMACHALYRKRYKKGSLKKFNVDRLYDHLDPILLKAASKNDPQGIVDL